LTRQVLRGEVTRRRYAPGSKSEHDSVMIVTDQGEYRLRRRGGNPFSDPALDELVGKRIEAEGTLAGPSFILDGDVSELS
jgi:hypothetical protein